MHNNSVVDIRRRGTFSLEEAKAIIPLLRKVTENYVSDVENKMARLDSISSQNTNLILLLEEQINCEIHKWHSKVRKLGGEPKGLWMVNLDAGNGYFSWKYPERELKFWHSYQQTFHDRIPLSDMPHREWAVCNKPSSLPENVVVNPL